jgi:hypothetical protein
VPSSSAKVTVPALASTAFIGTYRTRPVVGEIGRNGL